MLFTTPHSITNLVKEKNLKCDKILEAVDVIRESSFFGIKTEKIEYRCVFTYPHALSFPATVL